MDKYEVENLTEGLRNYVVPIEGTTVKAYLAERLYAPGEWAYSLWIDESDDEILIGVDHINFLTLNITPEQVARIAFLLHTFECECAEYDHSEDN